MGFGVLKIVRAAEIILGSRAADCREIGISVHIKLYFAFSPPAAVVDAPRHICSDIMTLAFYAVKNGINLFIRKRINTVKAGVKICAILRNLRKGIINLIEICNGLSIAVFKGNAEAFSEWHLPVAVKRTAGINTNGK